MKNICITLAAALWLAACGGNSETAPPPAPQSTTDAAVGHSCTMNLSAHTGPKSQFFLNGKSDKPVSFSTITHMFGYTKLP